MCGELQLEPFYTASGKRLNSGAQTKETSDMKGIIKERVVQN